MNYVILLSVLLLTFHSSMKQLLDKFRIPVSDVVVIPDITTPPSGNTKAWFDSMICGLVHLDSDPNINNTNGKKFLNFISKYII